MRVPRTASARVFHIGVQDYPRRAKIRVMERRDFIKLGTTAIAAGALAPRDAAAALAQPAGTTPFAAAPIPNVRIGYVGGGGQGSSHVRNLLKIQGCQITAVCDVRAERTDWATKAITDG